MQTIRSNTRDVEFLKESRRVSWEELINLDDVPRSWLDAAASANVSPMAVLRPASSHSTPYTQPLVVETASPIPLRLASRSTPYLHPACYSTPALNPDSSPALYAESLVVDTQGDIHAPTPFPSPVLGMLDYTYPTHGSNNSFRPVDDGWIAESTRAHGVGRVSSSYSSSDMWCGKLLLTARPLSPLSDVSFGDDFSEYSDSDDEEMEFLNEEEFEEEFEV